MDGATAAGAHMVVSLARQGFGNFYAERDERLRHLLAGATADIEDTSRREQALERTGDPRRIEAGPPARHAVEPHADGAARFPPLDFRHASLLPSKIADEVLVLWRIAQVDEGARGALNDLPRRGGIAAQRAKRLAAAFRAGSDRTFDCCRHDSTPQQDPQLTASCHTGRRDVVAPENHVASLTAATIFRAASSRSSAGMTESPDS